MLARFLRFSLLLFPLLFSATCFGQSAKNPGVIEVEHPEQFTQILAVSDVHGMYPRLLTLLRAAKVIDEKQHWSGGKTLLVVCGDSIDKGPQSLPILQLWRSLMSEALASGGRVVVLLGNHEAEFLKAPMNAKAILFQQELIRAGTTPAEVAAGKDKLGVGNFLLSLPLAARVGTYLFSHAGWYPPTTPWKRFSDQAKQLLSSGHYEDDFITGPHSILEEKDEIPANSTQPVRWYDDPVSVQHLEQRITNLGFYGIVFGHQPRAFGYTRQIGGVDALRIVKIDSGMAPAPDGDDNTGELLRFPHPAELLRLAPPQVERVLPDGKHAQVPVTHIASIPTTSR